MTCRYLTTFPLTHLFVRAKQQVKSSFIMAAFSAAGTPSSKRVLAALALIVAILIIPVNMIFSWIDVPYLQYFDSLLIFAASCFAGTVIETLKSPTK